MASCSSTLQPPATVTITEQPVGVYRFRYESEGKSRIPGEFSRATRKSSTTIKILGYEGKVLIVISCVTKDEPYGPHQHKIVGNGEEYENGQFKKIYFVGTNTSFSFNGLGIERVLVDKELGDKKKKIKLNQNVPKMDLSVVRLKFEVFCLGPNGHYNIPLTEPVYSVPIYNSTSTLNLIIADMSSYRSSIHGGVKILLFCDKINAQDIAVRFFKEINGEPDWEAYGTIQYVHKQFGITFTTPEYTGPVPQTNLNDGIECFIQLEQKTDKKRSEAKKFYFIGYNILDSAELPKTDLIDEFVASMGDEDVEMLSGNLRNLNMSTGDIEQL